MIGGEINDHFIVDKLRGATGGLPVEIQPDVGLLQFIEMIVHYNIGAPLQSIFNKLLYARQFFLSDLGHIIGYCLAVFVEISIEIGGLIIFPGKLSVLNPVLTKLYGINLCTCG